MEIKMTEKITNGDYVLNGDCLEMTEHISQMLQEALSALSTRRGKFYPDKNFGTALLADMRPFEKYALACARQAVDSMDGIYVKNACAENKKITYDLILNGEERQVAVDYDNI